jgi:hypothetical protein
MGLGRWNGTRHLPISSYIGSWAHEMEMERCTMRYVVGYGQFEIVREATGKPFVIYNKGTTQRASKGEFWTFAAAREECDAIRNERRRLLR